MLAVVKATNSILSVFLVVFFHAASTLMVPSAHANIIDTTYGAGAGSFEIGSFVNGGGGYMALPAGSTAITGWWVGGPGDGVDWLTTPIFRADTGDMSLDLQHLSVSSIYTLIPTVAGASYEISFAAAGWLTTGSANGVVSAGSLVNQPFTAALSAHPSIQTYTPFTFLFTATGETTMIEFMATGADSTYGPVIDSVSVDSVAANPEPGTLLLLGMGLVGMLGYGLRRRRPGPDSAEPHSQSSRVENNRGRSLAVILIVSLISGAPAQASLMIDFESLPVGAVVTTQFPHVTFSSETGFVNRVFSGSPASAPNWLGVTTTAGAGDFLHDTFLDFAAPVNNFTFRVVGDHNSGVIGKVDVFENGVLASTVDIIGDGNTATAQLVDLSFSSNVTRIRIHSITDLFGLGYDDFSFDSVPVPEPASLALVGVGILGLAAARPTLLLEMGLVGVLGYGLRRRRPGPDSAQVHS